MVDGFRGLIQGVSERLGQIAQSSPFKGAHFSAGSPFQGSMNVGSPFGGGMNVSSPFTGQNAVQNPFSGSTWKVGSPFQGGFQVGSPFGGGMNVSSPFQSSFNVQSPFGGQPFQIQNVASMEAAARGRSGEGSSGSSTSGSIDYEGPATASDNEGVTGQQLDSFIASKFANSPLVGQGQAILDAANRNGVSALLMLGIAWKESGMGSNVGAGNIWGITDPSRDGGLGGQRAFENFGTVQAEIEGAAKLLGSQTYRGKSIGEQIGAWYVGPQEYAAAGLDATDRAGNGTVREYINNFVAAVYSAFGKGVDPTTKPTQRAGSGGMAVLNNQRWEQEAMKFMGIPYTNGGIRSSGNPRDGMDCSSFVGYVMGIDRNLWNAQVQYDTTRRVEKSQIQRGDLVFFAGTNPNDPSARPVSHVGIALGNGKMIHTGGDGGVMVVDMNSEYWQRHYHGAGRLS